MRTTNPGDVAREGWHPEVSRSIATMRCFFTVPRASDSPRLPLFCSEPGQK